MAQPAPFAGLASELEQLGREAAALARRLAAAQAAASASVGHDPSEQVQVTLAPDGRIASLLVATRWRSRLTVDEVGGAVLAACRAAEEHRLTAWAEDIADHQDQVVDIPMAATVEPGPPETIRGLFYLLQDASDRLDDIAAEATARSQAVLTGADPQQRVTATFTGGRLSGLDVDHRWAAQAGGGELAAAVTNAIRQGYEAVDRLAGESLTRQWPFPDLQRITGDPATLLATLGLPAPRKEGA